MLYLVYIILVIMARAKILVIKETEKERNKKSSQTIDTFYWSTFESFADFEAKRKSRNF
jgi:hypothetical protein